MTGGMLDVVKRWVLGCSTCDGPNYSFTDLRNHHCLFFWFRHFRAKNLSDFVQRSSRVRICRLHALNFDQELNFDNGSNDCCIRPVAKYHTAYRLLWFSCHFDNQRTTCCLRSYSHPIKPEAWGNEVGGGSHGHPLCAQRSCRTLHVSLSCSLWPPHASSSSSIKGLGKPAFTILQGADSPLTLLTAWPGLLVADAPLQHQVELGIRSRSSLRNPAAMCVNNASVRSRPGLFASLAEGEGTAMPS